MCEFVKENSKFLRPREFAVNRDKILAHHAIVKTADAKRHFDNSDLKLLTKPIEISFGHRAFVPIDAKFCYFVAEDLHIG